MLTASNPALTVDEVADHLQTSCTAVRRLVARGVLKATALGTSGGLRVMADDVSRYVAGGAPDFDMPALAGTWYGDDLEGAANGFAASLANAAEAQVPDNAALVARLVEAKGDSIDVPLTLTPAIQAVLASPTTPGPFAGPNAAAVAKFGDMREVFLAQRLRDEAKRVVDDVKTGRGVRLEKLFASPAEYDRLTALAVAALLTKNAIGFTRGVTVPVPGGTRNGTVYFSLRVAAIAPADVLARVKRLAF